MIVIWRETQMLQIREWEEPASYTPLQHITSDNEYYVNLRIRIYSSSPEGYG
jgi:hypothetical protein